MIIDCASIELQEPVCIVKSMGTKNTYTKDNGFKISWLPMISIAVIEHVGIGRFPATMAHRVVALTNVRHINPTQEIGTDGKFLMQDELKMLMKSQQETSPLRYTKPQETRESQNLRSPKA